MTSENLFGLTLGIVALLATAVTGGLFCYLRFVVAQRVLRLEEALRVYNTANASLGRQVTALEAAVQELRRPASVPAEIPLGATDERPRQAPNSMRGTPLRGNGEFSEAELRLAHLIKSRLSSLRIN